MQFSRPEPGDGRDGASRLTSIPFALPISSTMDCSAVVTSWQCLRMTNRLSMRSPASVPRPVSRHPGTSTIRLTNCW